MNEPHDMQAECSLLSTILLKNSALDELIESNFKAQDFYIQSHRMIYEAALALYEKHAPIDLITLSEELKNRKIFDVVGGQEKLVNLFNDYFQIKNIAYYSKIVRNKSKIRCLIDVCKNIVQGSYGQIDDVDDFIDDSETKFFQITDERSRQSLIPASAIIPLSLQKIEDLSQKEIDVTGLGTGLREFDEITSGLQPGQVIIMAARPGMGKTSLVVSMMVNIIKADRRTVIAFFSLEMSKEEIAFKFLSNASKIDSYRLKIGRLYEKDWPILALASDMITESKLYIDDTGCISVNQIRASSRRLRSKEKKLDLIVVDYLQLMKGPGSQNREREISEISRSLKELSKELSVPIIALSQLNRQLESRQDKRPNLSDLRESGSIEQDADLVCFIHREEYYNKNREGDEENNVAELIIAKNRAGPTGKINLIWNRAITTFENPY